MAVSVMCLDEWFGCPSWCQCTELPIEQSSGGLPRSAKWCKMCCGGLRHWSSLHNKQQSRGFITSSILTTEEHNMDGASDMCSSWKKLNTLQHTDIQTILFFFFLFFLFPSLWQFYLSLLKSRSSKCVITGPDPKTQSQRVGQLHLLSYHTGIWKTFYHLMFTFWIYFMKHACWPDNIFQIPFTLCSTLFSFQNNHQRRFLQQSAFKVSAHFVLENSIQSVYKTRRGSELRNEWQREAITETTYSVVWQL